MNDELLEYIKNHPLTQELIKESVDGFNRTDDFWRLLKKSPSPKVNAKQLSPERIKMKEHLLYGWKRKK